MDSRHTPLLAIARRVIEAHLADAAPPEMPRLERPLREIGGLFISLHQGRRLRGCVGRIGNDDQSLSDLVSAMAVAVLRDPRFVDHPVTLEEFPHLTVEISILTPMWRAADPLELQLGEHGIYVRRGPNSGCFLPQVAAEMRWDREQLLSHCCCDKAGLPADAWRDPETELHLFTTEILAEPAR